MEALRNLITLPFQVRTIDFGNKQWHLGIPNKAGWYFIVTNAPVNVLEAIDSPLSEYTNDKNEVKKCRNYDIPARIRALASALSAASIIITREGLRPVYSGIAKNLLNRAREHTFAHKGTAGLALANYPALAAYDWQFHYIENTLASVSAAHRDIILKLGEQIWRANNGWPILCSD